MEHALLLFGAGLLAGAMNAAAGGGSFVSLPVLIFAGIPSVNANASSTVALFPGAVTSTIAYRDDFREFDEISVQTMLAISLVGGLAGALLLLFTSQQIFDRLLPWLLLFGTLTFAFGRWAGAKLLEKVKIGRATFLTCQFLLSLYGGYFGGAVGIMMMATWSLLGWTDIKAINASKTLYVGATNSIAVAAFIIAGRVVWQPTLVMLVAAMIGGYLSAKLARRLDPEVLRVVIMAINFAMTAIVFARTLA